MEDPGQKPDRFELQKLMLQATRYSSVALQFGVSLLVFGYGGYKLDEKLGWSPWATLVGILAGMGLGLWNMIRQLNAMEKHQDGKNSR